MAKIFDTAPYYDDYTSSKNYSKILFTPGKALQARELTQLQSILQNQISNFSDHIFKEGSVITGGNVRLNNTRVSLYFDNYDSVNSNDIFFNPGDFLNKRIFGTTSGAEGIVVAEIEQISGSNRLDGIVIDITSGEFVVDDTVGTKDDGAGTGYSFTDPQPVQRERAGLLYSMTVASININAITANVEDGIFYALGTFLNIAKNEIVVDHSGGDESYKIGFIATESIVTSATDTSLVDPSAGFSNANAPGADRHKIDLVFKRYTKVEGGQDDWLNIPDNFFTIIQIDKGVTTVDDSATQYNDILKLLAERDYNQLGNFTVADFPLQISQDENDAAKFKYVVEPGHAFVQGYEVETIASTIISADKTRTNALKTDFEESIPVVLGSYFEVGAKGSNAKDYDLTWLPSPVEKDKIYFWSGVNGTGTMLGEGRLTSIESRYSFLRLYFSDGSDTSTNKVVNKFSGAYSISDQNITGSSLYANIKRDNINNPVIQNKEESGLLIPVSKQFIKEFSIGSTFSTSYTITRAFNITGTGSTAVVTKLAEEDFYATGDYEILAIVDTTNNTNITHLFSSGDDVTDNLTITFSQSVDTLGIQVIMNIKRKGSLLTPSSKTLTTLTESAVINYTSASDSVLTLIHSDIIRITSIVEAGVGSELIDQTSYYLDDGQRDSFYLKGEITIPAGQASLNGKTLDISYEYFTHLHPTNGGFFVANSYNDYENIPTYISKDTGRVYDLRDTIDFRTKINQLSTASFTVAPNTLITDLKYNYYIPRRDKLVIDENGAIEVLTGTPNDHPVPPIESKDALVLYNIFVPPYVFNEDDIEYEKFDNKGYQMSDIGILEERINDLEYSSALNALESNANDKRIVDSSGFDKLKTGIVVDNFTGHGVGDITSREYNIAIDGANNTARSLFDIRNEELVLDISASTGVKGLTPFDDTDPNQNVYGSVWQDHENIITLDYTTSVLINQNLSSEATNVNPYNVFSWNGSMKLLPGSDNWVSNTRLPDKITDIAGNNDGWKAAIGNANKAFKSNWGFWEKDWQGVEKIGSFKTGFSYLGGSTSTTQERNGWTRTVTNQTKFNINLDWDVNKISTKFSRAGWKKELYSKNIKKSIGDRIVSSSIILFMRKKKIRFFANGLKPVNDVIALFDGVDVTKYIVWGGWTTPVSSYEGAEHADSTGGAFNNGKSNQGGFLWGTFELPDGLFRTGTKILRLEDATNPSDPKTSCEASFTSSGLQNTKQKTIISTEVPQLRTVSLSQQKITTSKAISLANVTRTSSNIKKTTKWVDPLAQSFLIEQPGGCFVTSLKIKVKYKDSFVPLSAHIVENENGVPSQRIVPFSDVSLSPYELYPVGHPLVGTNQINAKVQGRNGVDNSLVNSNSVDNDDASSWTQFLFSDPVYLSENTEYSFVIMANSNNYEIYTATIGAKDITSSNVISKQPYAGVMFKSQNASTWTADQTKDITFQLERAVFNASGTLQSYYIPNDTVTEEFNAFNVNTQYLTHSTTSIDWSHKIGSAGIENIVPKNTVGFETTQSIYGGASGVSINPLTIYALMSQSSPNNNLSPIISKNKNNILMIESELGSQVQTTPVVMYDAGTYVTKNIKLNRASDDLKVIFDMYKSKLTDVDVFYKTGDEVKQYINLQAFPTASSSVYESWSDGAESNKGETFYVYHYTIGTGIVKQIGYLEISSADDTNNRLYVKNIASIDPYIDAAYAGNLFDSVLLIKADDVEANSGVAFDNAGGSYNLGEYTYLDNKVYMSLKAANTDVPSAFSSTWSEIPSFIMATGLGGGSPSETFINYIQAVDGWKPMTLQNPDEVYVNELSEYEFEPSDVVEEEFVNFKVKVVLKAASKASIPALSSFRAIATF